ncbi:MAG: hypothetical protein U9O98_07845 [Asgard group archaeon]|nr:hypothetical protein [Asgard group archaeon]
MKFAKIWFSIMVTGLFLSTMIVAPNVTGAERSWNVSDIYTWGHKIIEETSYFNSSKTIDSMTEKIVEQWDAKRNISAIDILTKRYDYYRKSGSGSWAKITNTDYSAANFISDELSTTDFFSTNYIWDSYENRTILLGESISLATYPLIEPDWIKINNGFKTMLNSSVIIEQVYNPVDDLLENITLHQFLTNMTSFNIMGENNLAEAKKNFGNETTKWTFVFDLSEYIMYDVSSYISDEGYLPFDDYVKSITLEYSEGGVLKTIEEKKEFTVNINNGTRNYLYHRIIKLGGLDAFASPLPIFPFLAGFATICTIIILRKKRK